MRGGKPSRAVGSEFDLDDIFVPDHYEVYAAMVSGGHVDVPAQPTVFIELTGFRASELPLIGPDRTPTVRTRILLEVPGAEGIAAAIVTALGQLHRLAENQERP